MPDGICTVAECDSPCVARGLCNKHYLRMKNTGTTDERPQYTPDEAKAARKEAQRRYRQTAPVTPRRTAYNRWRNMIRRCTDPTHKSYPDYGGRGIAVCPEWLDFETYYAAVGDAPEGMSLDRIDNDRGYEAGNVRWAERSTQTQNRRPYSRGIPADEASRTHCPKGHPYDEGNTYRHGTHRYCRACNAESAQRRREARRAASEG
jgi:hypothetical protein